MKGKMVSLIVVILMIIGSFGAVGTQNLNKNDSVVEDFIPGEVIVGFHTQLNGIDPIDVKNIDSFEGHNIKEKITALNVAVIEVTEGKEQNFIDSIFNSPLVKYAEPNWIVYATHTPNDPQWNAQWGPQRINCDDAWDIHQGSSSVTIAIVDTGVDYTHEDLSGNYITGGYDHVNSDNDPMDDNDHGSHCAGIAAAVMDNSKGIAGVAQVNIMAEKVLSGGGSGSASDVAAGITHAANNGADIISMSLGSSSPSSVIKDACDAAYDDGVLIVAASGNDYSSQVGYPAAFDSVIAIGSIDNDDTRSSFSNYGDELELVAPGRQILSTTIGDDYEYFTGTSMATPHVAGVAALAMSRYPSKDNVWIRQKLRDTAEDLGDEGWDEEFGYGLVDATLGGAASDGPKVDVTIYKVKRIDAIDLWGDPSWYYRVSIDSQTHFEYDGYETQFLFWWIFHWNLRDPWTPDKTYSFTAENSKVLLKIKLMEHDDWPGADDLADVSGYSGGGKDDSTKDKRGAIFQGKYDLVTNDFIDSETDTLITESGYYTTSGEYQPDGSTNEDENDAKVWFKISDNYNADDYKPKLNVNPTSINFGTVGEGETVKRELTITNTAKEDPFNQNPSLNWQIEKPSWVDSVNPSSGSLSAGNSKTVVVTINTNGMEHKDYSGTLKVTSNGGNKDIPISITVPRARPRLTLLYDLFQRLSLHFPFLFSIIYLLVK